MASKTLGKRIYQESTVMDEIINKPLVLTDSGRPRNRVVRLGMASYDADLYNSMGYPKKSNVPVGSVHQYAVASAPLPPAAVKSVPMPPAAVRSAAPSGGVKKPKLVKDMQPHERFRTFCPRKRHVGDDGDFSPCNRHKRYLRMYLHLYAIQQK